MIVEALNNTFYDGLKSIYTDNNNPLCRRPNHRNAKIDYTAMLNLPRNHF